MATRLKIELEHAKKKKKKQILYKEKNKKID